MSCDTFEDSKLSYRLVTSTQMNLYKLLARHPNPWGLWGPVQSAQSLIKPSTKEVLSELFSHLERKLILILNCNLQNTTYY